MNWALSGGKRSNVHKTTMSLVLLYVATFFPCKCALKITNSYKKSHFLVLICFSADNDDDDEDEIVANDVTAEKSHREETSGRK